nr:MAG TPA: hypothetical protein [Caudoviricetes sp.]
MVLPQFKIIRILFMDCRELRVLLVLWQIQLSVEEQLKQ